MKIYTENNDIISNDCEIREQELVNKFIKWFELNLGWFFVNGRKQSDWAAYLRKKYGKE